MTEAREVLDRVVPLFGRADLSGFADMFAEDGVHELPFAPPGVPRHLRGREHVRAYLTAVAGTPMVHTDFRRVSLQESADGRRLVAEYDVAGEVTGTGQEYVLRYLWVLEVENGEITLWRDYWTPLDAFALLGRLPDLVAAMS